MKKKASLENSTQGNALVKTIEDLTSHSVAYESLKRMRSIIVVPAEEELANPIIGQGSKVKYLVDGEKEEGVVIICAPAQVITLSLQGQDENVVIATTQSPIGMAFTGLTTGDRGEYKLPNSNELTKFTITGVTKSTGSGAMVKSLKVN